MISLLRSALAVLLGGSLAVSAYAQSDVDYVDPSESSSSSSGAGGGEGSAMEEFEEEPEPEPADEPTPVKISKTLEGKAIIRYRKHFKPKPGEIYILSKRSARSQGGGEAMGGGGGMMIAEERRDRLLGIKFDLSSIAEKQDGADEAVNSQILNIDFKYGWNSQSVEYGPVIGYSFTTIDKIDIKTLLLGGFFDFNFSPNTAEATSLWAFRATLGLGQDDNSAQPKEASINQLTAGLVYKWFGLSTNFAFDFDVSYMMRNRSLDSQKSTQSGIIAKLGLQTYF